MKQTCILILGMHRSGTSALTGVLSHLNIELGSNLMQGAEDNPKGYFENNFFYRINEDLLYEANSNWSDIYYTTEKISAVQNYDALKSILTQEFSNSNLFAIKDPRLIYLFPIYEKALQELNIEIKIILPYRNPVEVAASLHKRNHFSIEKGMLLWANHFLYAEKYSRHYQRCFVNFDELLTDPRKVITDISHLLNLDLLFHYETNEQTIIGFLEPNLKHHNLSNDDSLKYIPKLAQKMLAQKNAFNESSSGYDIFDSFQEEFYEYRRLFYHQEVLEQDEALHQMQEENSALQLTIEQREGALQQSNEQIATLKETIAHKENALQHSNEQIATLKETIERKENALLHSNEQIATLKETIERKENTLQHLSQQITALKGTIDQQKVIIRGVQAEHSKLQMLLRSDKRQLKNQINNLSSHIQKLEDEIYSIYCSVSWKITKPLRKLKRLFK